MTAPSRVRVHRVLSLLGGVIFLGCGSDSTGVDYSMDGDWRGSASPQGFNLFADLTISDGGGSLTGSGTLSGTFACNDVAVAGHRSRDHVTLSMTCPGYIPVDFSGDLSSSGSSVTGSISGSGFSNTPFDLIKQ